MAQTLKITGGDWDAAPSTGRPILIEGRSKLKQDIAEFFTIQVLPNGFGTGLEQMIGLVEISQDMFVSVIDKQIREGLNKFIDLIRADVRIPRTAGERIVSMSNLKVSASPTDPTLYIFSVNIITEDGSTTQHQTAIPIS